MHKFKCLNCNEDVFRERYSYNKRVFCSDLCKHIERYHSHKDHIELRCLICGEKFQKYKGSKAKTCSVKCAALYRWKKSLNR